MLVETGHSVIYSGHQRNRPDLICMADPGLGS
jgi:hypothetical protein